MLNFLLILTLSLTDDVLGGGVPPIIVKQPVESQIFFKVSTEEKQQQIEMTCDAEGSPMPKFHWIKNGKDFNISDYYDRIKWRNESYSGSIIFSQTSSDDEGEYFCYAENINGIARTNKISLRRAYLENFKNITQYETVEVNEGDSMKLSCNAPKGEPTPNIFWMVQTLQGAIKSVENPRVTLDPSGNLWFSSVSRSDESKDSFYVCSAASNVANEYKLGNRIKLKVTPRTKPLKLTPPTIQYVSSSNITMLSGRNVELFCIYDGRPMPTITWSKNGKLIENSERIYPENFGKSLKIKKVEQEKDEGIYECLAANERDEHSTTRFIVTVETLPTFTVEPEARNVTENEAVELLCDADGVPKPQIQWFFNGKLVITKGLQNKIILKSATKSTSGNYACYATNKHGFIYKDIYINFVHSSR